MGNHLNIYNLSKLRVVSVILIISATNLEKRIEMETAESPESDIEFVAVLQPPKETNKQRIAAQDQKILEMQRRIEEQQQLLCQQGPVGWLPMQGAPMGVAPVPTAAPETPVTRRWHPSALPPSVVSPMQAMAGGCQQQPVADPNTYLTTSHPIDLRRLFPKLETAGACPVEQSSSVARMIGMSPLLRLGPQRGKNKNSDYEMASPSYSPPRDYESPLKKQRHSSPERRHFRSGGEWENEEGSKVTERENRSSRRCQEDRPYYKPTTGDTRPFPARFTIR